MEEIRHPVLALLLAVVAAGVACGQPLPAWAGGGPTAGGSAVQARGGVPGYPGLTSGRIFVPGGPATPGHWVVVGDGSGPIIVGGEVFVPGGPGRKPVSVFSPSGGSPERSEPAEVPGSAPVRSSQEILEEVERERERHAAAEPAPVQSPPLPRLQLKDFRGMPARRLLELADARDLSVRASSLDALASVTGPATMRARAVRKLVAGLDEEDLRVVRIAVQSLAALKARAAVPKLVTLLNLEEIETLQAVAGALAAIGDPAALPALRDLANAGEGPAAAAAVAAVAQLERQAPAR